MSFPSQDDDGGYLASAHFYLLRYNAVTGAFICVCITIGKVAQFLTGNVRQESSRPARASARSWTVLSFKSSAAVPAPTPTNTQRAVVCGATTACAIRPCAVWPLQWREQTLCRLSYLKGITDHQELNLWGALVNLQTLFSKTLETFRFGRPTRRIGFALGKF